MYFIRIVFLQWEQMPEMTPYNAPGRVSLHSLNKRVRRFKETHSQASARASALPGEVAAPGFAAVRKGSGLFV